MQACQFIFLTRNWARDKGILTDNLAYCTTRGYPIQLLYFPEGTDLSDSNRLKSHKFAEKNGLQKYDYVLHPRTTGFVHCLQELRKGPTAPNIVNVTVGYVGNMPQNESDILAGRWPREIHFCAETVPSSEIPSDKQELTEWLQQCWKDKEELLKRFYTEEKFPSPYLQESGFTRTVLALVLIFWTVVFAVSWYTVFAYRFAMWAMLLLSVFYIAIGTLGPGLDWLVLQLHKMTYQAKLFK